jgi:UDP-glucose 4-epimerase
MVKRGIERHDSRRRQKFMVEKAKALKCFVTGGAGFIGSHLVDRLMQDGNQVTVYDKLVLGTNERIKHHLNKPGFEFVRGDLLDFEALKEAMKGHEVVWHLGANTDIRQGNVTTDLDLKNCTIATYNVLEAMRQLGIGKILFASSACVYGDAASTPIAEDVGPLLPINLYGAGKLADEGLISAYSHLFGIKAWIFRFANVVGARMDHGVIFDFIQKLKRNRQVLEVLGDGNQEKPFFLVEDCIDGMLCAYEKSDGQCEIYNLGCGSSSIIKRLAEIVVEETGLSNVLFKYTGGKRGWPGDAPIVHFNIDKMKRLEWQPKHTSDEAVRMAARRLIDTDLRLEG